MTIPTGVKTTCLFKVTKVSQLESGFEEVTMKAEYDGEGPHEKDFAKYTPDGSLYILVNNPNVVGHFKPGQKYYIDITPVDDAGNRLEHYAVVPQEATNS